MFQTDLILSRYLNSSYEIQNAWNMGIILQVSVIGLKFILQTG